MKRSALLKVTFVEQNDWSELLPIGQLTETQKDLIRLVAQEAVREYVKETRGRHAASANVAMHSTVAATGFLRLHQILEVIPVGKTSWWKGVRTGRFPKPVKLSARCTAWRAEDIQELMKSMPPT